ncbi:myb/SANT-like DNA-binding domain-containing protein 3 [Rhopalosiphum padi]|uniref:myb/SANT-like DNA-binding domain-containing protein 3 n=1 Tax=Rhopalosiphum padi TaxID=40932 RepID=UPI00298DE34E|nr:myb/SANT-like DNA-binding domain-containing protein 3 [Rhopalosiphum padi]
MSKSKAFIAEEITCLEELILKYKHIITTKKSDSITVALKQKTWMTVEKEFNAQGLFVNRTADQLKKRWENMLQSRKKELAAEKQERRKTGGGQVTVVTNQSPIDELIDTSVNFEIPNVIDGDNFEIIYTADTNDNSSEDNYDETVGRYSCAISKMTKIDYT